MTAAHTTGPWEFVDNALVGPKIDDKPIWLRPVILRSEVGVNQKDADLIAAAPELLEALRAFSDYVRSTQCATDGPVMFSNGQIAALAFKARAAIAKATGEAP